MYDNVVGGVLPTTTEAQLLGAIEAVEAVDANPVTGSVLIHHDEDVAPIIQKASELQLFELTAPDSEQSGPVLRARPT